MTVTIPAGQTARQLERPSGTRRAPEKTETDNGLLFQDLSEDFGPDVEGHETFGLYGADPDPCRRGPLCKFTLVQKSKVFLI
jgi:hypothetical protein